VAGGYGAKNSVADQNNVTLKITRSGHQMELKLYGLSRESGNIIFIPNGSQCGKADWEELDKFIEAA